MLGFFFPSHPSLKVEKEVKGICVIQVYVFNILSEIGFMVQVLIGTNL